MRRLGLALLLIAGCGNDTVTAQSGAAACITADACGLQLFEGGGSNVCRQIIS